MSLDASRRTMTEERRGQTKAGGAVFVQGTLYSMHKVPKAAPKEMALEAQEQQQQQQERRRPRALAGANGDAGRGSGICVGLVANGADTSR